MPNIKCDWIVCRHNSSFNANKCDNYCKFEGEIRLISATKEDIINENIIPKRLEKYIDNENCGYVLLCDNYDDMYI